MPAIVRGIRHRDIYRHSPIRDVVHRGRETVDCSCGGGAAPVRRPAKDAAKGVVQALQALGTKLDAMQSKTADAEAKLDRISPAVAAAAEDRAMRDAMAAHNAHRDERLKAIRDGKPIRPETTEEMAAIHARHYGRAR